MRDHACLGGRNHHLIATIATIRTQIIVRLQTIYLNRLSSVALGEQDTGAAHADTNQHRGESIRPMKTEVHSNSTWRGSRRVATFLSAMSLLNIMFAAANVFLWSVLAMVMADPIAWATWHSLGSVNRRPDLFEYPFILLWGLPLLGSGVGALNNLLGFPRLAKVSASFPLALFTLTLVWWTFFRHLSG
jgi:hypothetical protein